MPILRQRPIAMMMETNTRRHDMAKAVNCPCGEVMSAETDDELVTLVQQHGKDVHNQAPSREDVLAMAHPAD